MGPAAAHFGWDPLGGTAYVVIPNSVLVRTDATADTPTVKGYDDLLVADPALGIRIIHGRDNAGWLDLTGLDGSADISGVAAFFGAMGASSAIEISDQNADGRSDFAVLTTSSLRVYAGGGVPGSFRCCRTLGAFTGMELHAAGDVDGDAKPDLLITGSGALVFGGALPASATYASLFADPDGAGPLLPKAMLLPGKRSARSGDFDGDGLADLAAAVLLSTDKLNEVGEFRHQAVAIFLGRPRADLLAFFANPSHLLQRIL